MPHLVEKYLLKVNSIEIYWLKANSIVTCWLNASSIVACSLKASSVVVYLLEVNSIGTAKINNTDQFLTISKKIVTNINNEREDLIHKKANKKKVSKI